VSFHSRDSGRILFLGRLEPMKGVDTLLRAFAEISPRIPPHVHLRIVGDGSERKSLEALAAELDIASRVTFAGSVTPRKAYDEYAQAEIFCGLSRSEALGNVFLEAQASGCAVVATRVGGIPEIVEHERTGLLVEPDDPHAAAAALKKLLLDMPLRARLVSAAKKSMEKYGWSGVAKKYVEVLESL
jgi:glycosyltransferase involved in cell wall biosynthesis